MEKQTALVHAQRFVRMFKPILLQLLNAFDNLRIRTKLFVFAGLLILLMLGPSIFARHQVRIINEQLLPARAAVREMESALLSMRLNEEQLTTEAESLNSEFYLKRQSNSTAAWQENYQLFESNYNKILELYQQTKIAEQLKPVQPQLKQYQTTFLDLTSAYQERGFQSFGREGALQQRADALEASLANRPQALLTLLKLRQAQNNFLLHQEISELTSFDVYAVQLDKQLTNPQDRTLLEEYRHLFDEVVALYKRIGFSDSDGLRGNLNRITGEITPRVALTENEVLTLTNKRVAAVSQSILLATTLVALAAVGMAFLVGRYITRRFSLLLAASERITSGSLEYRLDTRAHDEFGQLAIGFNIMTEKLAASRKALRERAQDLAISLRRFELVSRAVNEAIYEWDLKTDALNWGDGLVSVFGYSNQHRQTVVDWWVERIHPDDAQAVNNSLSKHMQRKSSAWQAVYRFKKASGQYAYCQDRGFIEYHNGQPVRMVGSLVDITRQKELERAKDEFISIASHQLRTPLGSIRWNLDLLMEKAAKLPHDMRTYVGEAYHSTLRMLDLVSDLLSVARIEQGRVQDMPEKTNLTEIIMLAFTEMQPIARQRKVHLDTAPIKHMQVEVVIDPKRFREVIQNLLSNAVKYTPAGGKVTVKIQPKAKDIVISVADTGMGIPPEEKGNLFSKFFRAKNVMTTDTEGSGLGLFVVKSYIEGWGGHVWFDSELNVGTTFYLSIPRDPRSKKQKA